MFVYQREPHARQMAFADVAQPKDLGERCELARKTCDEMALDPSMVWIDGMDDQSRALFGDLPSPAIVVDPFGVIRAKLPWAEPEALGPVLRELLTRVGLEAEKRLLFDSRAEPGAVPDLRVVGAMLHAARRGGELPDERMRRPPTIWAAALGVAGNEQVAAIPESWLGLVACATLAVERPADARWQDWIDRLVASTSLPVRHWALQLRAERAQRQLDALRRDHPWLEAPLR